MRYIGCLLLALFVQPLAYGDNTMITELQRQLNRLGYEAGAEDDADRLATRRAIRNYQRVLGIEPTGEASDELLSEIRKPCKWNVGPSVAVAEGGCHKPLPAAPGFSTYRICLRPRSDGSCQPSDDGKFTDAVLSWLTEKLEEDTE